MTDNIIIFPKPKIVCEESDIVNKEQIKKQYDIIIKQQEEIIKQRNEIWQT